MKDRIFILQFYRMKYRVAHVSIRISPLRPCAASYKGGERRTKDRYNLPEWKISLAFLSECRAHRVPHPAYSSDLAPSNVLLFRYLKTKLAGLAIQGREEPILRIRQIFDEISKETLISVYLLWNKDWRGWSRIRRSTFISHSKMKVWCEEFSEKQLLYDLSDSPRRLLMLSRVFEWIMNLLSRFSLISLALVIQGALKE
jgi:hypothetical protein